MSALEGKADILTCGFMSGTSLLCFRFSLLPELGRRLCQALRCRNLSRRMTALSLQFGEITLHFRNCRERRVGFGLPAQPPSRRTFVSLATLAKVSARSPELRHQLAAALPQVTRESAFSGRAPLSSRVISAGRCWVTPAQEPTRALFSKREKGHQAASIPFSIAKRRPPVCGVEQH
jgi:hypothetical protein